MRGRASQLEQVRCQDERSEIPVVVEVGVVVVVVVVASVNVVLE